jgi:methanogenic corrinoid protein MtbC1
MEYLDQKRLLNGRLKLSQLSSLANIPQTDLRIWTKTAFPDRSETQRTSLFSLYRIYLVSQLLENGHDIADVARMPLDILRRSLMSDGCPSTWLGYDWTPLFECADTLDTEKCNALISEAHATYGPQHFAMEFCSGLMKEVEWRWRHSQATVAHEHFLTLAIRSQLSSILMQPAPATQAPVRMLVTTPAGELHEVGAMIATIIAKQAGVHATFLGAQLPVSEIMTVVDRASAHIVCLASQSLDRDHLAVQMAQLREVIPEHVLLCLGGAAMDSQGLHGLRSTLLYDDFRQFSADMAVFTRLGQGRIVC